MSKARNLHIFIPVIAASGGGAAPAATYTISGTVYAADGETWDIWYSARTTNPTVWHIGYTPFTRT
jgi:hypothetical protein